MKELFWFQKELSEEEGMGMAVASLASPNASPNLQNHPQLYWEMAIKSQLWVLLMSARVLAAGRQLAMPISHTLGECSAALPGVWLLVLLQKVPMHRPAHPE